jgi:hypothetical protein
MSARRLATALLGVALLGGAYVWLAAERDPAGAPPPAPAPPAPAPPAPPPPAVPAQPPPVPPPETAPLAPAPPPPAPEAKKPQAPELHGHAAPEDPYGDLALYADHPMSEVAHRVVRGWGAGARSPSPGHVGAYVVVDPAIDDAALRELALDIRDYHRSAEAVAVRIVDSEEAATYDRHTDGGARLQAHLVASVRRDERLGLDEVEIRGERISRDAP